MFDTKIFNLVSVQIMRLFCLIKRLDRAISTMKWLDLSVDFDNKKLILNKFLKKQEFDKFLPELKKLTKEFPWGIPAEIDNLKTLIEEETNCKIERNVMFGLDITEKNDELLAEFVTEFISVSGGNCIIRHNRIHVEDKDGNYLYLGEDMVDNSVYWGSVNHNATFKLSSGDNILEAIKEYRKLLLVQKEVKETKSVDFTDFAKKYCRDDQFVHHYDINNDSIIIYIYEIDDDESYSDNHDPDSWLSGTIELPFKNGKIVL